MHTGWQLAIVDLDIFPICKGTALEKELQHALSSSDNKISSGKVVYICSTMQVPIDQLGKEWQELAYANIFALKEVPLANIWIPDNTSYGWAPLYLLRPIITEADAVEAELKFGISLKDHM